MEFLPIIFIGLLYGVVVCIIPLVIIIEIYHWLKNEPKMKRPYLFSVITSSVLAVALIALLFLDTSGESGFALIAMSPFIFSGFAAGGALVGRLYKNSGRTIIKRSNKAP
jgi:CDP-diglyceride synthetase